MGISKTDRLNAEALGRSFGKWKVLERDLSNPKPYFLCECECGQRKSVRWDSLKTEYSVSCGCHKYEDLTGKTFERLTVERCLGTRPYEYKSGTVYQRWWACKCACGGTCEATTTVLTTGNTRSCGCLKKESDTKRDLTPEQAGLNHLFCKYQASAKSRNLEFSLTKGQFWGLITQTCFYCGESPVQVCRIGGADRTDEFLYNGVDRLDSSLGYTVENCAPCCSFCNRGKMEQSVEQFIARCRRISALHDQRIMGKKPLVEISPSDLFVSVS